MEDLLPFNNVVNDMTKLSKSHITLMLLPGNVDMD